MDVQLTDDEAAAVDYMMNEHMHGHQISNSYHNFTCDVQCRTDALKSAINKVLKAKKERL